MIQILTVRLLNTRVQNKAAVSMPLLEYQGVGHRIDSMEAAAEDVV